MTKADPRPEVWIGHIEMKTDKLDASEDFMIKIGMRPIFKAEGFAILELRGGTHIILTQDDDFEPGMMDFDLMVDDITQTHQRFCELELEPSVLESGRIHQSFTVTEPAGNTILFNSTHVSDEPV